ncbi:hypothetical protein LTR10_014691 [Elasticomyces elasticus]|uniref:Fungal N-terminal domain-containing protein n=1 Tax=Exophiala sideris TaxID=1016849 RepID=A0ABR0J6S6_9EURO|nr:hypothetical protein LTR10_014691 [Elasticomyces elasticus]KAK5029336.1 hypothetical protein LTS07_005798 [Exophiala sideris]KAK5036968.1 hypothetical protein LTR13_005348 [Exophiala sideris]KAK5057966.1 hypothetical protein LTR69_006963 [Exophiala sideris]KAK5181925.1 hypothetical protein LTR44_005526 [Eurotiomycetes sp. CCFEE 6388]
MAGVTVTLDEFMKIIKNSMAGRLQEIRNMKAIPDCTETRKAIEQLEKLYDALNTSYNSTRHQHSETLKICAFFNTTTLIFEARVKRKESDLQRVAANELSLKTQVDVLTHHLLQEKSASEHLVFVAGELQKELDSDKAIARKREEQLERVRAELIQGKADVERAKEINKEYERLKTENQLNEANIEGLQKRNQDLILQLQKATTELKKLKDLPSDRPDTQGESAGADLASVASRKSFSKAAAVLLQKLKGTLDQLCTQINGMKETRGGNGWGIVERTAGMVTETKTEMTKEIDDCLKLRPRDKESTKNKNTEELSIEDFPRLPAPALLTDDNKRGEENMESISSKDKSRSKKGRNKV